VAHLPPEYRAADGARLARDLKSRRDRLPQEARLYYRHLAGDVDVFATDKPETVEARWLEGGALDLSVAERGAGAPYFHRKFVPGETEEVRLHFMGGEDAVTFSGTPGRIRVRILGGPGCDTVRGSTERVRVSDDDGCTHGPPTRARPGSPRATGAGTASPRSGSAAAPTSGCSSAADG
jgi:hypothetical protein